MHPSTCTADSTRADERSGVLIAQCGDPLISKARCGVQKQMTLVQPLPRYESALEVLGHAIEAFEYLIPHVEVYEQVADTDSTTGVDILHTDECCGRVAE
jgi:hypothetical protein